MIFRGATRVAAPLHFSGNRLGCFGYGFSAFRQIGIKKAEHVSSLDRADAFALLQISNALAKLFHLRPMHLWPEMVLGVITVVEEEPVIDFPVAAHAPCNRFVGIRAVMPVIAVQITKAVAEIPKRQEKEHEPPVDEVNRFRWHNDRHHEERRRERRQLDIAPEMIAVIAFAQFSADRADIVTEETQEHIAPWTFRFGVVPMPINRQPINRVAIFILSIRIPFVVLHVNRVIHRL